MKQWIFWIGTIAIALVVGGFYYSATRVPAKPATISGIPDHAFVLFESMSKPDTYYKVTSEVVPEVGEQFGMVMSSGIQGSGIISNFFGVYIKLYKIPGVDPTQAIAADYYGTYIKLIYEGSTQP